MSMAPRPESNFEKGFWWAIGVIQVLILALLGYLANANVELQKTVTELHTTIRVVVDKDLKRVEARQDMIDAEQRALTQLLAEHERRLDKGGL